MIASSRKLLLGVATLGLIAMASKPVPELVQKKCGFTEPAPGFYIELINPEDPLGRNGSGPYIVAFGPDGVGIGMGGDNYAPDWVDIQKIVFERAGGDKGHLSLSIKQHGRSFVQRVGLVKRDCWNLGKKFLSDNGIRVQIVEQ